MDNNYLIIVSTKTPKGTSKKTVYTSSTKEEALDAMKPVVDAVRFLMDGCKTVDVNNGYKFIKGNNEVIVGAYEMTIKAVE